MFLILVFIFYSIPPLLALFFSALPPFAFSLCISQGAPQEKVLKLSCFAASSFSYEIC